MCRKNEKRSLGMLTVVVLIVLLPISYMVIWSFYGENTFSLMAYYEVLLAEPEYLIKFWRSLFLSLGIAAGQTLISSMAAFGFSKYRFRGWKFMFVLMLLFMLLPIQVMLLPNYLLLDKLQLLDSWWSLLLPNIFAPFGTVWLTFAFSTVPDEMLSAAKVDGANAWQILWKIMLPCVKAAVVTLFLLSFVESWNMVEQPITFLKDASHYPLSVFLVFINEESSAVQSVCGILCCIPVTLLLLYYREEFVEGMKKTFEVY